MPQRANVKPLTHWIARQGYTVRFTARHADRVEGTLTTPDGPIGFTYDAVKQTVQLPDRSVPINDYGWEKEASRNQYGSVILELPPSGIPSSSGPPCKPSRADEPPDDEDSTST